MTGAALSRLVDTALDRSVVLGFSAVGPAVRRRLPGWPADPAPGSLRGQVAAVTGATSGLGLATARGLLELGAAVRLVVRDEAKGRRVRDELFAAVPGSEIVVDRCDLGDLDDVRALGERLAGELGRLDVLVHNAGAMPGTRTESPQGHELTMSLHVLAPVLLTELLAPVLVDGARVLFVTSGGMYGQRLVEDDLEYERGDYSPTTAYARSKRVQVELLPLLQRRWPSLSVYATHPGWADTPGVQTSLPRFRAVMRPVLRDADGGAETTVWLAATQPAPDGGTLWHDRRQRPFHLLPTTRPREGAVDATWAWVRAQAGLG
jgi:NAD(P)-dependent dehydrogenase (short-subunit alcohol dehydrogenase family)